ncbi:MAG: hypothetical protein OEV77_14935, partial [Nitrospira sp.]|nr:hypothetical protein [Nitrospira sp.]
MLFITSRLPTISTEPELNPNFVFDLENNASSLNFFCCRRIKKDVHEEIGSKQLLSAIKNSKYRQVLMYIHGFSNLPEQVFDNVQEFQSLCDKKKAGEVLVI